MKNFSFKKLASKLQPIVIRALNTHMKTNLNAMNDNLDIGQDINEMSCNNCHDEPNFYKPNIGIFKVDKTKNG